jgi:hypothetical protein
MYGSLPAFQFMRRMINHAQIPALVHIAARSAFKLQHNAIDAEEQSMFLSR